MSASLERRRQRARKVHEVKQSAISFCGDAADIQPAYAALLLAAAPRARAAAAVLWKH